MSDKPTTQSEHDIEVLKHKLVSAIDVPTGGIKGITAVVVNASAYTIIASVFIVGLYWLRDDSKANREESKQTNELYRAEIEQGRRLIQEQMAKSLERADKVDERNREDARERWKALGDHTKAMATLTADVKVMSQAVNKVAEKVGVIVGEIPRGPESKPKVAEGASLIGPLPKKDEGGQ